MNLSIELMTREEFQERHPNVHDWVMGAHSFPNQHDNVLKNRKTSAIYGTVTVDGEEIDFYYSPYFADGHIFSETDNRWIVQGFVPLYWREKCVEKWD